MVTQERTVEAINNRNDIATVLIYAGSQRKRFTPNRGSPMKTLAQPSFAERIGRALGRTWRGFMRQERKAKGWLVAQGMNVALATGIQWAVRIALLGFVLYGAFWVALLLGIAAVSIRMAEQVSPEEDDDDFLGRKAEERDHRESVFYHPYSYNDDPDPRFEDD
jgi:hypothetical protein